ncbi:hypothetical protein SBX64_16090 [Vibrio rhizosphaerae]|uniref:Uncharacterized protein n=1 Tax=Vibrio rhizosphaerae TaxID=398736 RepID=A0ABU4IXI1_9VIBR|nr:hypothetical protein [Vibrio rhizosphaerae]MDW6094060.1 hypothetical protein [Vibrio rhizosphaerae]
MNNSSIEKSVYRFYYGDEIKTLNELPGMLSDGLITTDEYDNRIKLYESWLDAEEHNERAWRNSELSKTDYMTTPDGTYGGKLISGTSREQDILDYRAKLRAYNLRDEARPTRPEWYTG